MTADTPLARLRDLADRVRDDDGTTPLNPALLTACGITAGDIRSAIKVINMAVAKVEVDPMTPDFDTNPAALTWARQKIQARINKLRAWERQDRADRASVWRQIANHIERELIGTGSCAIAAFDPRLPEVMLLLAAAKAEPK